jgi:hypothetical protein
LIARLEDEQYILFVGYCFEEEMILFLPLSERDVPKGVVWVLLKSQYSVEQVERERKIQ